MLIAILGDLHIGARGSSDAIAYHQKKFFDFFFKCLEEKGIKNIIQLGDIFDARRQTNNKSLRFAYREFFDKLEEKEINFYGLVGNHCCYYKETCEFNSGELLLDQFDHVKIISRPQELSFDDGKFKIDAIPWICESNKEECLNFMARSTNKYCIGHFEINNFEVMPNVLYEGGLEESAFKKYAKVFSGHFHQKTDKGNIYYVGTPYQLTWGDIYKNKSFVIFNTETGDYEDVINHDNFHIYLNYDDVKNEFSNPKIEPHSFVKLVVKNKAKPALFNKFVEAIYVCNPADVKFIEGSLKELSEQEEIKLTVQTMEDIISNYISASEYNNKEALTKYMLTLYNEALMGSAEV